MKKLLNSILGSIAFIFILSACHGKEDNTIEEISINKQWLMKDKSGSEILFDLRGQKKFNAAMKYSAQYCKENGLNPNTFYIYEEDAKYSHEPITQSMGKIYNGENKNQLRFEYRDLTANSVLFVSPSGVHWNAINAPNIKIVKIVRK